MILTSRVIPFLVKELYENFKHLLVLGLLKIILVHD